METLIQDVKYALRTLRKQPGFTIVAVLTLAVGIGANTAMFSLVNATLLRPLPFKEPDRLMRISLTTPQLRGGSPIPADDIVWSFPKFETFRQYQKVFESVALYASRDFTLTAAGSADMVSGEVVNASYFPLLGITPEAGRTFLPGEDATPETHFVVVLGHSLWLRRFGGDPDVVGKTLTLDTRVYTIVGVLPAGFQGLTSSAELWVPVMTYPAEVLNERWSHQFEMVARLKPGVSAAQAMSAVEVLGRQIDEAHPVPFGTGKWGARARTLGEARTDPAIRRSVLVLLGAVGMVLLIACVNIANLLLARGTSRDREIAVRMAVGAGRVRVVRQFLTESVVLAGAGAVAGLALAFWSTGLLSSLFAMPGNWMGRRVSGLTLLGLRSIRIDGTVLLFAAISACLTGLVFGVAPALQASRAGISESLKGAGQRENRSTALRVLTGKSVLIVAELSLALVLLVASGLMIKSFWRLVSTGIGIDPANVLTLRLSRNLPPGRFMDPTSASYFREIETRAAALPGVQAAGLSNCTPLAGGCNGTVVWFKDRPPVPKGTEPPIGIHFVSPGYFQAMRIPLRRGRSFSTLDAAGAPKVVVINETAARKYFPNEDPIGKRIGLAQGGFNGGAEIVGIVGDVRHRTVDQLPQPDAYVSYLQAPRGRLVLFVRTSGDPLAVAAAVRKTIHDFDPGLPVYDVMSMEDRISNSTSSARNSAALLGLFASIALVLAVIGIYGVMSYVVARRTREIGIRVALGADRGSIVGLVMRRGVLLTLAGLAIGIPAAFGATQVLRTLLYDVQPGDPATYAVLVSLLCAVSLAASLIPAWRATRVDALLALRSE